MNESVSLNEVSTEVMSLMKSGIFLNTRFGSIDNTMIIGWGGILFHWGKGMVIVYVRDVRYSYQLLEAANCFTLSIPIQTDLKKAISICGSIRGEGINKFALAGLTTKEARTINAPIIEQCPLHMECKIIYKQLLDKDHIPEDILNRYYYPGNDSMHIAYYAEVVDIYRTRKDV
jgi:flavin reductase (DIM6/NTAB) family NADH-FMN oxidoreductase RutF